jgi:hypothetical protein
MKYLKFVFENEEVCQLTDGNAAIINVATQAAVYNSLLIENDIATNLESFISSSSDLVSIYESIKDYAISESISFYNQVNDILTNNSLSDEAKAFILTPVHEGDMRTPAQHAVKNAEDVAANIRKGIVSQKNWGNDDDVTNLLSTGPNISTKISDATSLIKKSPLANVKYPELNFNSGPAPKIVDGNKVADDNSISQKFEEIKSGAKDVAKNVKDTVSEKAKDVQDSEPVKKASGWLAKNYETLHNAASAHPAAAAALAAAGGIGAGALAVRKFRNRK